jgi:hypothetical protein
VTEHQLMRLVYLLALLVFLFPVLLVAMRNRNAALRSAAVWLAIGAGLFLLYEFATWSGSG